MSSKLIKPAQCNRPVPMKIELPYLPEQVMATITIIVLKNQTVQLMGRLETEEVGRAIMQAGMSRLNQHYAALRSPILGPDGQPLPSGPAGAA